MNIIERLQSYINENMGKCIPQIRYFNGLDEGGNSDINTPYCTASGQYKGKTLEESLDLFLKANKY